MLKKIFFHGGLKHLLPEPVEVEAGSALEAIRGLVARFPHLQKFVSFDDRHTVQIVGYESRQSLTEVNSDAELHVIPAMIGAGGGGGFMKIAIGVVLIAAAVVSFGGLAAALACNVTTGGALAAAFSAANATMFGGIMISLGASLIFGGLLSFLSPAPPRDKGLDAAADPEASKYLGVGQNTVRIGTRIPIGYGQMRVYGHFLSFDIQAKDVAV